MSEIRQRHQVIAAARRWIGTPYHHEGDVVGVGVDCGMLLIRVFNDCGLTTIPDPRPYARDWHLHRSEERYLGFVQNEGNQVDSPRPGDVVLWRYGRTFSHGGIVTEWGERQMVVHAYWPSGAVEESDVSLPGPLSDPKRERAFYSYWPIPSVRQDCNS